jgi:hypothetical protein
MHGTPTEGEGSVQLTSLLRLISFDIANIIYTFTKQTTLMRWLTELSLSPLVFPC